MRSDEDQQQGEPERSAGEYARDVLVRMHRDPSYNATWGVHWAAQPAPGEVLTPELLADEHIAMLQHSDLVGLHAPPRNAAPAGPEQRSAGRARQRVPAAALRPPPAVPRPHRVACRRSWRALSATRR